MRFRMLGPLELLAGDVPVPLGGTRQRATLGYLLLRANQVVPTSQLLSALWSTDNAPVTARKILQNAVWGLRGMFNEYAHQVERPAELVTRVPGYMIRVDPDQVDLHLFRTRVSQGRAKLSAGQPHEATALLSGALDLWCGPLLADLVETGIMWPELNAVQNSRLDVLEDYFEAKLQCGQHYAVLGELEATVEAEPLRERASGQLMLALYRCGRQAAALGVYNRIRATLVEDLGLEPGHELRGLQQAILAHDPVLSLPSAPAFSVERPSLTVGAARPRREEREPVVAPRRPQPGERPAPGARRVPVRRRPPTLGPVTTERRQLSVLLARTRPVAGPEGLGPDYPDGMMDELFEYTSRVAHQEIERFGGEPVASIGAVTLGLFRVRDDRPPVRVDEGSTALRAVQAGAALRDLLTALAPLSTPRQTPPGWMTFHASVATGQALLRLRPGGDPPTVNGALLDLCHGLLSDAPPGAIQVCDATRAATETAVEYTLAEGSQTSWWANDVCRERGPAAEVRAV
ncbi:BTAD domain-containing putative transcriptional regulator [Streptomyces sp. NPDC057638]|uniref:AfsR/SARP family transcriptional regulator n=1 Tax=Streptomyces sp. NPDC057638 TaxID=3346190 RepID=UPI003683D9D8